MTSNSPSPDFIDLWKRSEAPKNDGLSENSAITKSRVTERLSGERSALWTNLSQMSPSDQTVMMNKLTTLWPYAEERRALNWPMHAGIFTNCLTTAMITTKINSDMVMMNPKMSLLESVKKCPKSPFIFGVYSSGLTYYVLQQMTVMPKLYRETHPCASCVLTQSMCVALFTGVIMPLVATPYLCYYVLLQRKGEKFPPVKNLLDFVMLSWEGSRAARAQLIKVIPIQVIVTALSTYAVLWGRNRVFRTMDADPELTKELLLEIQSKPSAKERVTAFLRKIPLVSDVLSTEGPETERV